MKISIKQGTKFLYKDKLYEILSFKSDLQSVIAKDLENGISEIIKVKDIEPYDENLKNKFNKIVNSEFSDKSSKEFEIAKRRYEIIKPLLTSSRCKKDVIKRAKEFNLSVSTLYRWIKSFEKTESLESLVPNRCFLKKRKTKFNDEVEDIIQLFLKEKYLSKQKYSISRIYNEICIFCEENNLKPPSLSTVWRRANDLDKQEVCKKRYGKTKYLSKFKSSEKSFEVNFPLEVIQIDHTLLDIIVVDEIHRQPVGRPWITIAMDIYSRMVYSFFISLEFPSVFSIGQLLMLGISTKEEYLEKLGIEGAWIIYGVPKSLHLDNAKEFHSRALKDFCDMYQIEINYRPKGSPHFGGHIERFMRTLNEEMHNLPGTTFSNKTYRENYNSEKHSAYTLFELEKYIASYIVNIYHKKKHSSLGISPEEKYKKGIFDEKNRSIGLPPIIPTDEIERIRISLLPTVYRSIQKDGISLFGIKYFSESLKKYINLERNKKYTIKYDPMDLSKIYLWDSSIEHYFEIPYRNTLNPKITLSELKQVKKYLSKKKIDQKNEVNIFKEFKKLREIEKEAVKKSKKVRRKKSSKNYLENRKEYLGSSNNTQKKDTNLNVDFDLDNIPNFDIDIGE
ncbi:MAG TPA: hypothetical protein DEP48_00590 [Persephonella sp.]|uniref:TniA transposase n=1 Tax=Persephonella marina (strain DSM 14350 / EX-H1) TaxID=123214 RepID=C0QQY9_PERMH|nr:MULTISPECIES: Mu transposase C-terminal domain-containing protein [Persephonella]ACO04294.1 TniA transposase [Persephonella marina EX-H1]HCB68834.1 hypothetical protein [Persephonella sp.]